jgi:hypothetical protein
MVNMVVITLQC